MKGVREEVVRWSIGVAVVATLVVGLATFGIVGVRGALDAAKETGCLSNLGQIGRLIEIYRINFGAGAYPSPTGRAFVDELRMRVVLGADDQLFMCRYAGGRPRITYRGPAYDLNGAKYASFDPVVGDDVPEHPSGTINLLTFGYRVLTIRRDDAVELGKYVRMTSR